MEAADGAAFAPDTVAVDAHTAGVQSDRTSTEPPAAPAPASPAPAPVPEPVSVPESVPQSAAASVDDEVEGSAEEAAAFVSSFLHPSPMAVPSSIGASGVAGLPPLFPHTRKADADALNTSTGTTSTTTGVSSSAMSTSIFSSSSIFVEGKRYGPPTPCERHAQAHALQHTHPCRTHSRTCSAACILRARCRSVDAASAAAFASAAEVQSLSQGMSTVANTFTNMRHQASTMATMLRNTTAERDQLAEQVRDLQAKLAGGAGAATEMQELEMRNIQLEAELEAVRFTCKHHHTSTDLTSRLAEEKRTTEALRETLNAASSAKNAIAADLAAARTELATTAADMSRLKLELDQVRSELAAAHAASSAAAVTVADLDTRLRHAVNERDSLLGDKETLIARLRSAEAATSGMEASGHTYQQRLIDAEEAARRAREELMVFNQRWVKDMEELTQQLHDRDAHTAQVEAALAAAHAQARSLEEACIAARGAAAAASDEVIAVQASKAAVEEDVRKARASESAALAQVRELQTNVARLSAAATVQASHVSGAFVTVRRRATVHRARASTSRHTPLARTLQNPARS